MAITKRSEHQLTVLADGQIQLREDTIIEEDGVELARTYHRRVLEPTLASLPENEPARLKALAPVVWAPEVVAEYESKRASRSASSVLNSLENKV